MSALVRLKLNIVIVTVFRYKTIICLKKSLKEILSDRNSIL